MKRRDFLTTSCAAGLAAAGVSAVRANEKCAERQLIELRTYTVANTGKRAELLKILDTAAVPAWNRIGIKPVGVFTFRPEDNADNKKLDLESRALQVTVVLPHASMESVVTANRRLLADKAYVRAAAAMLDAPMKDPIYLRYESSLSLGFAGCPKVEVPTKVPGRLVQLRTYESHNAVKAVKKVAMFNEGGELAIFRKCNMAPVFFGESLVGEILPNLTYMLAFDDMEAKQTGWKAFISSPEWKALSGDTQYADTVSNITNLILRPTPGSQI